MIRKRFLYPFFILLVVACNNQPSSNTLPTEEAKEEVILSEKEEKEPRPEAPDWKTVDRLKSELVADLELGEEADDVLLMRYLNTYEQFAGEVNTYLEAVGILRGLTLMNNDTTYFVDGMEVQQRLSKAGLDFDSSEGMAYIIPDSDAMIADLEEVFDPVSSRYLKLLSMECEQACCDDASMVISAEEVASRAVVWGDLSERTNEQEYANKVQKNYLDYLDLLFLGLDNTPAFDWDSEEYSLIHFEAMVQAIEKDSDAAAGQEFQLFIEALKLDSMKQGDHVNAYLQQLFNSDE